MQDEPEECETCRQGVGILFAWASTDDVPSQINLLNEQVCAFAPDPVGCQVGVETWWPTIASIIFSPEAAKKVCSGISGGVCLPFR